MAKHRRGRINEAVANEMAIALREMQDPRLIDNFVSITRAEVAADLRVARVYFSALGDSEAARAGLLAAAGRFRHHLATVLNLRLTPELLFYADNSIEHGAHIARLLHEIEAERQEREESGAEE